MTETLAPAGSRRIFAPGHDAPLPRLDRAGLTSLVHEAGLTGRGGAAFPTARKIEAVRGRRPVVVGNAIEGEPLSSKDAVLLDHAPGLVIDGLTMVGRALRAKRLVLATGPAVPSGGAVEAARGTAVEVLDLDGGFVAGQESALVNQVNGQTGVPSDPRVPVYRRGVDGRPTLVLNAETLAQLALVGRYGAAWFRALGTTTDPGTYLTTLSASEPSIMAFPGVLEVPRGTPLRDALAAAGTTVDSVAAVLVGGYHGAWVPASRLDTRLTVHDLREFDASPGAGIVHALDIDSCPLELAARVAEYLAAESARQCGPCVNGLPRLAETLAALARPGAHPGLVSDVERLRTLVHGRGACAHPDGTARFVGSTLRVFAAHVEDHLGGECRATARRLDQV